MALLFQIPPILGTEHRRFWESSRTCTASQPIQQGGRAAPPPVRIWGRLDPPKSANLGKHIGRTCKNNLNYQMCLALKSIPGVSGISGGPRCSRGARVFQSDARSISNAVKMVFGFFGGEGRTGHRRFRAASRRSICIHGPGIAQNRWFSDGFGKVGQSIYFRLCNRASGPEIVYFLGLNGPLLPESHLEKVGASRPLPFSNAFCPGWGRFAVLFLSSLALRPLLPLPRRVNNKLPQKTI
jgi:hypothetical protein